MSTKLKALGLGLLAAMAVSAFAVMNASATTGGHFSAPANTTITGFEDNGAHDLEFVADSGGEIDCDTASYHGQGTAAGGVQTSISIAPSWSNCYTTSDPNTKFEVHENGCTLKFTVNTNPSASHNTVDICDTGGPIVITHPACTITVEKQTATGVVYTRVTENEKHAITLDSTVKFNTKYHGGICQLLGTNHTAEMNGSVTVRGEDANQNPVDITATGP